MGLFDSYFYSRTMCQVFSDDSRLRRMLEFESALASAQAACGLIPASASASIARLCEEEFLDRGGLLEGVERTGTLALPLVQQLSEAVAKRDAEAAKYVHWGATSQDAIDTGFILQVREALTLLDGSTDALCADLGRLVRRHEQALMVGRTWLQHAVPITFGWKAAGWLDAMQRHRLRLKEVRAHALTLQFGGASGTLASFGGDGWAVAEVLASKLGLALPDISWHTNRDRIGELATVCGLLTATLGKMARDISLLMQTEVGEVMESAGEGRGVSSTMPQKRNPVACASVIAAATRVPGLVATVLTAMVQEHERGIGNWATEWETVPEIFNLCAGALERSCELVSGLEVNSERMRTNLEMTHGLVMAEAVSMALAKHLGKTSAHERVQQACRAAMQQKKHLHAVLREDAEITTLVSAEELERLFDPSQYLGIACESIERVLVARR